MNKSHLPSTPPAPAHRAHSEPPTSPTITHGSSRGSTPCAPESPDTTREVAQPRISSPPGSRASRQERTESVGSRSRPTEDDKPAPADQRPAMPSSLSAPAGRLPRLLPYDTSHYSESYLPTAAVTTTSTSLAELAHLIRLQRYQEQRRNHARVRLHRWLVSSALSARLAHCGELAYRTLVDYFRTDDRKSFATLYNALHDVKNSCDATRRYALLEPDLQWGKARHSISDSAPSFTTFMHEIPIKIREELLEFISEIRTNPDFLASRIASLTQQELSSLTSFRQFKDPVESVMARQGRSKVGTQKPSSTAVPNAVERLLSFQRHDPLTALIFTVFANTSGPDSSEDLRRTDVWATTCTRLIMEQKLGSEKLVKCILDVWAAMREWPGKANLEAYMIQCLQDGQFLLETPEDVSARPISQPEVKSSKDEIAAEDFYDQAVRRLFEIIDDEPSAGGIPEGVIEIGSAIIRKCEDSKKHRMIAQTFIVSRWFFSSFLLNALIHPEANGIMIGHHISEHARQKIFKEIGFRVHKIVWDMLYNWKQAIPILPEIRAHVDSITARLRNPRAHAKPVLLPAKAITSPRETVEVQPYLVLSPSDIKTLVNTLFPERRPSSSQFDKDGSRQGLASAASSISGFQIPFRPSPSAGDASSVLSLSASSVHSDTASREPLLDQASETTESPNSGVPDDEHQAKKVAPTDEYGRRIRSACSEICRILGAESSSGSCHPCAERWAVLYVSADGKTLKTRMRKDIDDEDEQEDDSPDSDSDDEDGSVKRIDLESDYHQIKEAISKLVEEYEIPKELAPESESKAFSNRTSSHRPTLKSHSRSTGDGAATAVSSRNPYQSHMADTSSPQRPILATRSRSSQHPRSNSNADGKDAVREKPPVIVTMLEAAAHQCQARADFVNAHLYHKTLVHLRSLSSPSLTRNGYAALLNYFSRGPRDSLSRCASAIEEFEAWFVWLKQSHERQEQSIEDMMLEFKNLRDKMWYRVDVCNSAGYEEARSVALALKVMGQPTKTADGKPIMAKSPRNPSKTNNFLLKTETQVFDLMSTQEEFGGPNKLADEQSEMTGKWLSQWSIENFCRGEERIHRLCLEVDKCVNRLVGDGILDGPVLWSSELYRRDKEILDSGRQKGDLFLTGVGTLSIASDEEYESQTTRPGSRSLDFGPPFAQPRSQGSLRSVDRQVSQQSFESAKWGSTRGLDLLDSQDYLGMGPMPSMDSTNTFWSPFQAQAHSPLSTPSIRPSTASSSKGTVMLKNTATVNDDKRRFLLDLKQTLTGLLLSDLGTIVFSQGSETDGWFCGDLGEECIQRKDAEERRRKNKLARKKSMRSMKSAARADRHNNTTLDTLGRPDKAGSGSEREHHSTGEHSTSSSDATARSSGLSAAKKAGLFDFPYNLAFRRLLRRFATHPNPFSKLHALYELELLIVESLASKTGRHYKTRRDTLPTVPQSPTLGATPELSSRETAVRVQQAQNLEDAIANCTERRSHASASQLQLQHRSKTSSRPESSAGARSPGGPPSTDMIVDVLQGLFRDAEVRPKSLFRDLQYIAALVPASILDRTARGKAFWDAALAALIVKQDICRVMVEIADDIVACNTQNRSASLQKEHSGTGVEKSVSPPVTADLPPNDPLAKYSMSDAAQMYIITAKEGDAVAERELAIFYLTHPDLLQRTVLPLTKPKDVFKTELINRSRGGREEKDMARSDPMTMCVAQHWMEQSKKGGDQLAIKYLRARDEMERIP